MMTFDFSEVVERNALFEVDGEMTLSEQSGQCNGVVLWMDYRFHEDAVISTGLLSPLVSIQTCASLLYWHILSFRIDENDTITAASCVTEVERKDK